jgi:hypothetical protein
MSQQNPGASKIMIIRHAEKPSDSPPPHGVNSNGDHDKESLIVRGWQRAGALAILFAPSNGPLQNPDLSTPQFVYASKVGKDSHSERPQETITPLIDKLGGGVTVDFSYSKGQETELAGSAMACNGIVLICWQHQNIPAIAKNMPISPNNKTPVPSEWPDDRYDVVWIFDLDASTAAYTFNEIPQLLLAGDGPI